VKPIRRAILARCPRVSGLQGADREQRSRGPRTRYGAGGECHRRQHALMEATKKRAATKWTTRGSVGRLQRVAPDVPDGDTRPTIRQPVVEKAALATPPPARWPRSRRRLRGSQTSLEPLTIPAPKHPDQPDCATVRPKKRCRSPPHDGSRGRPGGVEGPRGRRVLIKQRGLREGRQGISATAPRGQRGRSVGREDMTGPTPHPERPIRRPMTPGPAPPGPTISNAAPPYRGHRSHLNTI